MFKIYFISLKNGITYWTEYECFGDFNVSKNVANHMITIIHLHSNIFKAIMHSKKQAFTFCHR